MLVIRHRERPVTHSASGQQSLSMVVNREVGSTSLSVWIGHHVPGEIVPLHRHAVEEVLTVIAGKGIVRVGDESAPIDPDMSIVIPTGTPYGYRNTGNWSVTSRYHVG